MIADIQEKFRKAQDHAQPNKLYKPRTQKKYKDTDDGFQPAEGMERPKRLSNNEQNGLQGDLKGGSRTAKHKPKGKRVGPQKDPRDQEHIQYLMPEMNELIGEDVGRRNYLT